MSAAVASIALHEAIARTWEPFPECIDALGPGHEATDVGTQLPHAVVRLFIPHESPVTIGRSSPIGSRSWHNCQMGGRTVAC